MKLIKFQSILIYIDFVDKTCNKQNILSSTIKIYHPLEFLTPIAFSQRYCYNSYELAKFTEEKIFHEALQLLGKNFKMSLV